MFKQRTPFQQNSFKHLPNPYNGYDPSSALTAMRPTAATVLENWFPTAASLETRDGFVTHFTITGFGIIPRRLLVYSNTIGGEQLFACTDVSIINVTTAGSGAISVMALTNGRVVSTAIATGAGNYMLCVNGVDTLKQYDGTTWTSVPTFGATSTVVYKYIETYRQRIYLAKRNSLEIEYLASNAVAGAATNYPLGALFRLGGYIVAMSVWTIDGGIGPEDNLCVFTSKGEVAVFSGNDPATWSLRGVYFAGRPLGEIPMYKYGGDVLLLTETGVVTMSSLIQSASIDRTQTVSSQIRPALNTAASLAFTAEGWQIISEPKKPMLLVNVPVTPVRKQFVMNSQTGAWTTFTHDAYNFARMGGELYYIVAYDTTAGTGNYGVNRITGVSDNGVNIVCTMTQAFNSFGYGGNKKIEEIRPYFETGGAFTYNLGVASDFGLIQEYTMQNSGSSGSAGIWGTSVFGTGLWSGGLAISNDWITAPDVYSMWKSLYIQTTSRLGRVSYIGSDILYKKGGNF